MKLRTLFCLPPVTTPAKIQAEHQAELISAPRPFDEMKLTDAQVDKKIDKLRRKGYFTIPMSPATADYLKRQDAPNAQWHFKTAVRADVVNLEHTDYAKMATATATKVVARLTQRETHLVPQEFEIRRPEDQGADRWHQDRTPKVLACLATLEGTGTEFVSPETFKKKFAQTSHGALVPKGEAGDAAIAGHIKQAKKEKFIFFAALGLADESVPKLVHRAPGEQDRSILLARWMEATRAKPVS